MEVMIIMFIFLVIQLNYSDLLGLMLSSYSYISFSYLSMPGYHLFKGLTKLTIRGMFLYWL